MITTNLDDVLFKVETVPTYAQLSKTDKIFTNYAIINTTDGKFIANTPNKKLIKTNQELMAEVAQHFRVTWKWAYYNNDKSYFHIMGHSQDKLFDNMVICYEIINSYDRHTKPRINYALHVFNKIKEPTPFYIYTDITAIPYDEDVQYYWSLLHSRLEHLKNTDLPDNIIKYVSIQLPHYVNDWYKFALQQDEPGFGGKSKLDFLRFFAIVTHKWQDKSFELAHKFSVKLTGEVI